MTRLHWILAIVLVLQIALAGVVFWSQRPAVAESSDLLDALEVESVVAVTLRDSDDNVVELSKLGDSWILANGGDYPANSEEVNSFLDKLDAVQTSKLVTRTAASHKRLQVAEDDFNTAVNLELEDGTRYALFVGSSPNPRSVHIRLADQDEVYLTDKLLSSDVDTTVSNWVDTSYVNLDRDQITAMVLENQNGSFELKKIDDEWTLSDLAQDEESDPARSNQLLGQLTTMRMTEPLGKDAHPEYGLDTPQAVLKVTAEDDEGAVETYTLSVGAHDAERDTYVVKSSDSPYYVKVAAFAVDTMVETTRDDFVKEPPAEDAGDADTGSLEAEPNS